MAILRARAGRPAGSPIAALRERAGRAAGCSRDELVPVRGGFDRALAGRKWLDAVHPALSYPAIYLTPRSCRKDGDAGIPRGRERAAVSSESRMTVVAALLPDPNGRAGRDVAEIRRPAGSTAFPAWRPGRGRRCLQYRTRSPAKPRPFHSALGHSRKWAPVVRLLPIISLSVSLLRGKIHCFQANGL